MKNASALLLALDEPIFELDLDGVVRAATASAQALAGSADGYAFAECIEPRDRARLAQAVKRLVEGKTQATTLEVSFTASGDSVPMQAKLAAITGPTGKPIAIGVWLRDLSLEKASEAAANVQGTHLLDLVENMRDACVVEGGDGSVEMINPAFCALFDIKAAPQSLIGTSCAALFETASVATERRIGPLYFPLDAAGIDNQRDELAFALASGENVTQTTLAVDGEQGIAGRLHLFNTASQLSAEPRAADSTIANQMALVERIAQALAVSFENASTAVHRAEQVELPGQIIDNLRRVEDATTNAFDAVAGLLDFSRIEGTPVSLEPAPFRLRESVAAMVAGLVSHAENHRVQLRVRIEQDVPEQLTADGPRLMQALRNIAEAAMATLVVEAATESTADGASKRDHAAELNLSIAPEYTSESLIHLAFAVELRGGVRARTMPASSTMQLALARQIVRAFGENGAGKLEHDERKTGAHWQFTAALPFDNTRINLPRPTIVSLTSLPVLIVSGNTEERKQLAEMAKSWRMLPREADNAAVALQLLERMAREGSPIPLVITANQLRTQDGFLLAFRIKNHPALKQTAIILLANQGRPGDAIACRENGISAYLRQPIAAQQLNEAITAILGMQDDAEATATLITRHSLREQKKAAVLIIDAARDNAMFAAAGLKKRDYRVVLVSGADEAREAMVQETFDIIVVDPVQAGFPDNVVGHLREAVGEDRAQPRILFAGESPLASGSPYDGMVLKPFAKDSLVNAVEAIVGAE
ncbi:MAG: response regulator [Burkholderiales bacterium]|nr:response regulator [Nitrosomonadaceae bacterium]